MRIARRTAEQYVGTGPTYFSSFRHTFLRPDAYVYEADHELSCRPVN